MRLKLVLVSFIIAAVFWMNVAVSSFGQTQEPDLKWVEGIRYDGVHIEVLLPTEADAEANLELLGAVSIQEFTLTGARLTSPATFRYNPSGQPSISGVNFRDRGLAGVLLWNNAGANIQTLYGGDTTLGPSLYTTGVRDGQNVVAWGSLPGLAIGVAAWSSNECDVLMDNEWPNWSNYNVREVAGHEWGHCLGLGHSAEFNAIMWSGCCHSNGLHADDIAGVRAIYGVGATATSTASPTQTSVPATQTPVPKVLYPGWNLIGGTGETPQFFVSAHSCVTQIYQWNPDTQEWLRYFVGAPNYVNNITVLHKHLVHWVHCS